MTAETKKIRFLTRAGDPRNGAIIQPGTVIDFPAPWADRYIHQNIAELAETPKAKEAPAKKKAKKG